MLPSRKSELSFYRSHLTTMQLNYKSFEKFEKHRMFDSSKQKISSKQLTGHRRNQ